MKTDLFTLQAKRTSLKAVLGNWRVWARYTFSREPSLSTQSYVDHKKQIQIHKLINASAEASKQA